MKNIMKIVLSCLLMLTICFTAISCGETETKKALSEVYSEIFKDVNVDEVREDVEFPSTIDDVQITYQSTDENIMSNSGAIVRGDSDKKVYVIVTLTRGEETYEKTVCFNVKAEGKKPYEGDVTATLTLAVQGGKINLSKGDTTNLIVTINGESSGEYEYSYSKEGLVTVSDTDVLSFNSDIKVDTSVVVTCNLKENKDVKDSITVYLKAPVIEGQYGDLTSEMINTIGNQSITVKGTVDDYYTDFNQSYNSSINHYEYTVYMEENKWNGSWNKVGSENVITDTYVAGNDVIIGASKKQGHALMRMYIDKNNVEQKAIVKNYVSQASLWEEQHLWNHLSQLANYINKFTYDEDAGAYHYVVDVNDETSLYLMTYLSFSLTPMLEDTLNDIWLFVDTNTKKITKMLAQTEVLLYGGTSDENGNTVDPDAKSYTVVEFNFENIGTTVVPSLKPFDAPSNVDVLKKALDEMKNSRNYTFRANETTTVKPQSDASEYEYESLSTSTSKKKVINTTSSTGTVGWYGQVTEDAVLIADTMKYEYSMDGEDYSTSYFGYKKINNDIFDYFELHIESEKQGETYKVVDSYLNGVKQYHGNIFDVVMPKFDLSPNIFKFAGSQTTSNNRTQYTFTLRETSIMREVAMQLSMHDYADDASANSQTQLSLVVDQDGHLVSVTFPYSLVGGTYMGYIQTTYSKLGTTVLPEDTFENYHERVLKQNWSEYLVKYYSSSFSTLDSHEESAEIVFSSIYGDVIDLLPNPSLFFNIVGDNFYGPFYDWISVGVDGDGNEINHGLVSITVKTDYADENQQMSDEQWQELLIEFKNALEPLGYKYNISASNLEASTHYVVYDVVNETGDDGITIKIENNGTRYLWIYFYQLGDFPKSAK